MSSVIKINKPRGFTPLQVINSLKANSLLYKDKTLSYAGRLDPMAEGLLIVLVDDENKKRHMYENLKKDYTFEVLFGISTDTYDVLGKIIKVEKPPSLQELQQSLPSILLSMTGTQEQVYPPYSSFHVKGKPLFYWARAGKLDEITLPKREITITSIALESISEIKIEELVKEITSDISKVQGEFRQKEILSEWNNLLQTSSSATYVVAKINVSCGSGTYVRVLADTLGKKIGCGALAYSIIRTKVGDFTLKDAKS